MDYKSNISLPNVKFFSECNYNEKPEPKSGQIYVLSDGSIYNLINVNDELIYINDDVFNRKWRTSLDNDSVAAIYAWKSGFFAIDSIVFTKGTTECIWRKHG